MKDDAANKFRIVDWDRFIGQNKLKRRVSVHIAGASAREDSKLDNIFLHGPSGCGKTTFAGLVASKMNVPFYKFIMPVNQRVMRRLVAELSGVVLLDEIHRASTKQQESLLTLIEDGYYQPPNGHRVYNLITTYIGATTERDKVITPLYDRFQIKPEFEPYTDQEMALIALGMMHIAGIEMSDEAEFAFQLGMAAGGLPRNLLGMVNMARDLQHIEEKEPNIEDVLEFCAVTHDGLTEAHVKYMEILNNNGSPMGLTMLATHLQLGKSTILDLERLLVQRGWIDYGKGRDLTTKGHIRINKLEGK